LNAAAQEERLPHKMRDNIEGIAMAILMAVGLKYFLIEAYEIPTPSMQPVLMGSRDTGIHDRILVNKAAYLLRAPQRFDVAVFRYPHVRSQNYVKRIVGLPGERLKIIGGDVYKVLREGNARPRYEIVRKPSGLQDHLWKLMYDLATDTDKKRTFHFGTARGYWTLEGDDQELTAASSGTSPASTSFMPESEPYNHYWHGYPDWLREQIQRESPGSPAAAVGDLRCEVVLVPDAEAKRIVLSQAERPEQGPNRLFTLRVERGEGDKASATLEYAEERTGAPPPIQHRLDVDWRPGRAIRLELENYDDRLVGRVGGREIGKIDYAPPVATSLQQNGVDIRVEVDGKARVTAARLWRDLYYLPPDASSDPPPDEEYVVPPGHYWMLGDNTRKSDDGRSWRAVEVWPTPDGKLGPIGTPGTGLAGNFRFRYDPSHPTVDTDDNPVVVASRQRVVFTDIQGEEHVFEGRPDDFLTRSRMITDGPTRFVPRDYFLGRAFATFWPANPFGWFRVGLIR
jgi:signal peptidase I